MIKSVAMIVNTLVEGFEDREDCHDAFMIQYI